MARPTSESRTLSSPAPFSPAPFPEPGPSSSFGSPGTPPSDFPAAEVQRDTGSTRLLWTAAFTLGTCAILAFIALVVLRAGTGGSVAAAVAGAVAALLLLVTLVALRLRYDAVGAEAVGQERHAAELQRRVAELEWRGEERQAQYSGMVSALTEAVDHLVRVQLPAALNGSGAPQSFPGSASDWNGEVAALCNRIAVAAAKGAARLREHIDDQIESSRLAVVMLARRVQASAHRIQEEATQMSARHPADSDVLESSMRVDHAAAQQARHAQSVAVLCGEWPGQQWPQPLALLDVVRAASSRIVAYRRVAVSGEPDVAATASAVEPLIHLVAELLANATQSSPPSTKVLVTVRTVQRGAVIEIDDGGVGMEEHQIEQTREILSGRRLLSLGDLGEIPQTGMAVIGQYVRRHGFGVDLAPSPYGGVRAIVLVPADIVENLELAVTPAPPPLPAPVSERESGGSVTRSLPQRRSRRGESEPTAPSDLLPAEPALLDQTPEQAGAWMAAYLNGSDEQPEAVSSAPDATPAPPTAHSADSLDSSADSASNHNKTER